jgi:hypothetical protein
MAILIVAVFPSRLSRYKAQRHGLNVRLEALPFHLKGEVQDDRQQQSPGSIATRAVRIAVGIRCGAFSGNMKVSFQAARSIG